MATRKKTRFNKRFTILSLLVVLMLLAAALYLYHRSQSPNVSKTPTATIHSLPAQSMANNGEKTPSTTTNNSDGSATDTNGSTASSAPTNQWTVSQSGLLTLKEPAADSILKSGGRLIGSTTSGASQVQFRLIDNQSGVLAQGAVNVSKGNFSGTLNFSPVSKNGRLDVFTTDGNGGAEQNEIQINLRF